MYEKKENLQQNCVHLEEFYRFSFMINQAEIIKKSYGFFIIKNTNLTVSSNCDVLNV